jgi:hypothetical protein
MESYYTIIYNDYRTITTINIEYLYLLIIH